MSQTSTKTRLSYLDTTKGFAILSVVLLHFASSDTLFTILAPWHIWHAMPFFLFVAGVTGSMVWKKYQDNYSAYYRDLPKRALTLYAPYAVGTVLYHMVMGQTLTIDTFFNTMVMGYLGPGGYFITLIVTHLAVFPLVLTIRKKLGSDLRFLGAALVLSIFFEALFAFCDVEATQYIYRIFYFRYLFVACLGAVLADGNPFSPRLFAMLAAASALYILMACYMNLQIPGIRSDAWSFQHYPGYFFTAALVLLIRRFEDRIPFLPLWIKLGKNSYDIFIFQLFFFVTIYPWFAQSLFHECLGVVFCLCGGLCLGRVQKIWADIKKS